MVHCIMVACSNQATEVIAPIIHGSWAGECLAPGPVSTVCLVPSEGHFSLGPYLSVVVDQN